jgi:hypothetical protein
MVLFAFARGYMIIIVGLCSCSCQVSHYANHLHCQEALALG